MYNNTKTKTNKSKASVKAQKPLVNNVSLKKTKNIPDTIQERRKFIIANLECYKNKCFPCKALGIDAKVLVTEKSIGETAFQGAISKTATKLALQLPDVIKNATVLKLHLPIASKRQKDMGFTELENLITVIPRIGTAKLTVGYTKDGYVEYAITDFEVVK